MKYTLPVSFSTLEILRSVLRHIQNSLIKDLSTNSKVCAFQGLFLLTAFFFPPAPGSYFILSLHDSQPFFSVVEK